MASKVRFVKNSAGFRELMNRRATQAKCLGYANRIAAKARGSATYANASYTADVRPGANRCHARAKTANKSAWWGEVGRNRGSGPLSRAV